MKSFIGPVKEWVRHISDEILSGRDCKADAEAANLRRLFYTSIIAAPVSLVHIILFSFFITAASETEELWRVGILISHIVLTLIMLTTAVVSFNFQKRGITGWISRSMQYLAIIAFMMIGLVITVIDQLVTTNITPFLIACMAVGFTALLHPFVSGIVYTSSAVLFAVFLRLTQQDHAVMISNQVNGYTATGLGLVLSIILWQSFVRQTHQKKYILEQQHELEQKNNLLDQLASVDSMTGLRNRRSLQEEIVAEMRRMRRHETPTCLIILDLDYFKDINDRFGHPAGDYILIQVAGVLQQGLRETDTLARWGGEEFAILAPDCDLSTGSDMAERLRHLIEVHEFIINETGETVCITASFGVAELLVAGCQQKQEKACFEAAYRKADKALYMAKRNGRNRVETVSDFACATHLHESQKV